LLKKWDEIVSADPDSLGWLSAGGMDMQTLKWMRENTKVLLLFGFVFVILLRFDSFLMIELV